MSEVLTNAVQNPRPCSTRPAAANPAAALGSGSEAAGPQRDDTGKAVSSTPKGIAPSSLVAASGLASAGSTTDASQPHSDRRAAVRLTRWDAMAAWRRRYAALNPHLFASHVHPPAPPVRLGRAGQCGRPTAEATYCPAKPNRLEANA